MTTWIVACQVVGEAGPGLWGPAKRVLLPNGAGMPLYGAGLLPALGTGHNARLEDALPAHVGRIG